MIKGLTIFAAAMGALCSVWVSAAQAQDKCEAKIGRPPLVRKGVMIAAINPTVAPIQYIDDDGNIAVSSNPWSRFARLCLFSGSAEYMNHCLSPPEWNAINSIFSCLQNPTLDRLQKVPSGHSDSNP